MASEITLLQPIHPETRERLLPEYAEFHDKHTAHTPGIHQLPWNPIVRNGPPVIGGSEPLPVGSIKDIPLSKCTVRVFTPPGDSPSEGWPVFLFFHGGGWTLGNIDTENAFSTNMCIRARCVVVSVDYRLGPEQPYPAAVEDAEEALHWIYNRGQADLGANLNKVAVGGSSSGGNLAAIAAHKAALSNPPIPLVFQLLVVPVVDNTASLKGPYPSWVENANTVSLVPEKMIWFRRNYAPNEEDWAKWDNSPMFAPDEAFKKSPPAWIAVCELDVLRDEGIAYGNKLKSFGVSVETKTYKGAPHPIMAMDGVLKVGRQLVSDAAEALAKAFGTV